MPHNGQKCEQSGIYSPSCGCKQIALSKGDTFPPCGTHGNVTWTLTQPTQRRKGAEIGRTPVSAPRWTLITG